MTRTPSLLGLLALLSALAGCASPVAVHRVASNHPYPLFDLQGDNLVDLQDQAQWACGGPYDILRQDERGLRPKTGGNALAQGWVRTLDVFTAGDRGPQHARASLLVACHQDPMPSPGSSPALGE